MSKLNKHNSDLKIGYIKAIKKVVCYLKGIIPLRLIYKVTEVKKKPKYLLYFPHLDLLGIKIVTILKVPRIKSQ